jgi:hypothetical protein
MSLKFVNIKSLRSHGYKGASRVIKLRIIRSLGNFLQTSMETVEYVELFWDCPECGQTHISAIFNPQGNRCPNCLYWRVEDVELYEAPDSKIVTDPKLIDRKPFWICKVCDAVNEDTGIAADLLQCSNCDSYQVSEVGGITGNVVEDRQAPNTVAVGETVELRTNSHENRSNNSDGARSALPLPVGQSPNQNKRSRWLAAGIASITLVGGGLLGNSILSSKTNAPATLQVQVTDLQWTVEIDVEEKQTFTRQSWRDSVPAGATIVRSQTRQRGTRQEQKGFKTVMVEEQYQSGTRSETYYESERYQSGTRSETYYESERYQSSTRSETYYESERYQSSTKQECKTTSRGNGVGQRKCKSVPIYSNRKVARTRSVPIYSTRKVPYTRSIPIYSIRKVPYTRSVPIYSTRKVPVQEPIMVSVPVRDTWVTYSASEWIPQQTYRRSGQDDDPRNADLKLAQLPLQRISATRTICRLNGTYTIQNSWFEKPQSKSGTWELPCQEYDRVEIGERVKLRQNTAYSANLM